MTESIEASRSSEKEEIIENTRGELDTLNSDIISLDIKKESFGAKQELKDRIKTLGFYDGDENGETIKFNIVNIRKYLESIKNKTWSELAVKSTDLEKGVRTIAIQITISYINNKNGEVNNHIDLIDGVRGGNTWRGVKEFQVKYKLKNRDGLPGHETITKVLELLGGGVGTEEQTSKRKASNMQGNTPSPRLGDTPRTAISGEQLNNLTNPGATISTEPLNIGTNPGVTISSEPLNIGTNPGRIILNKPGNNNDISDHSEGIIKIGEALKKKGNQNNIDDVKCINLLSSNLKINDRNNNLKTIVNLNTSGNNIGNLNNNGNNFEDRLKKNGDKGGIEGVIFRNPEVQNLLSKIVVSQGQELTTKKTQYEMRKLIEKKDKPREGSNGNLDQDKKEAVQSFEDYKHEKYSPESFEEFVLSDEGRAIIIDEIKSHIDTSHTNENGEYDKFYEKYPVSAANLEVRLRAAWESKMQWDYYAKFYGDSEEDGEAKKEEMEKLDVISNQITGAVDRIIGEYIKSGKEDFDQEITSSLELLLAEGIDGVPINELCSDQKYKDTFKVVLASKISNYGRLVRNKDDINLNTGDKQVDLQLRSYLYIYGSIFYSDYFKSNRDSSYYEEILPEIMKTIMSSDDTSLVDKIKHKEFWILEQELEKKRKENDLRRRQEAAEKIRRRNSRQTNSGGILGNILDTKSTSSNNLDGATGAEIVEYSGIELSDYNSEGNLGEAIINSELAGRQAFGIAWEHFKKSNKDIGIEGILTRDKMEELYTVEGNDIRFNEDVWKIFLGSDIMKLRSQEEIENIYKRIKSFPGDFSDALETINSGVNKQEEMMDEETKKYALGEIIDNVRGIFSDIVKKLELDPEFEGFRFNKDNPVERKGNDIVMSGTFNGTAVKIRYELNSGGLFINSFLQSSPGKIIIGNNTNANLKIGQLDSFDKILDDHYRIRDISFTNTSASQYRGNSYGNSNQNPGGEMDEKDGNKRHKRNINFMIKNPQLRGQHPSESTITNGSNQSQYFRPSTSGMKSNYATEIEIIKKEYGDMLYNNIDMIENNIMSNTKKQSAINSVVTKFMKTFNIIHEDQEYKNIEFNDGGSGSDLFDFLEIVNNSDSDTLNNFQLFMKEIAECSGLDWGTNNIFGPQMNSKSKDTFDEDNQNVNISLLRDCRKDFSAKFESFNGKLNFEPGFKFGFAKIIKENLINDVSKPNRKLDEVKMHDFLIKAGLNSPF